MHLPMYRNLRTGCAALALSALSFAGTSTWAQSEQAPPPPSQQGDAPSPPHDRPSMEQMQERTIEHLTRQLNLTPDQVTQVRTIYKDGNTQMMSLRDDNSLSREDKRDKLRALHESSRAKIRSLLTEEQKPRFDEMIAHQHDRMERHGGEPGAPPPPAPPTQ